MDKNAKIFVAGHRGLVGSAIVRKLKKRRLSEPCFKDKAGVGLV